LLQSPFTSGTTITVTASVEAGTTPESWCTGCNGCWVLGTLPFIHVNRSNGWHHYAADWSPQAYQRRSAWPST
jgi:hypothetical protein